MQNPVYHVIVTFEIDGSRNKIVMIVIGYICQTTTQFVDGTISKEKQKQNERKKNRPTINESTKLNVQIVFYWGGWKKKRQSSFDNLEIT